MTDHCGLVPLDQPQDGRPFDIGERPDEVGAVEWEFLRRHADAGSYTAKLIAGEIAGTRRELNRAWKRLNEVDPDGAPAGVW